jgi:enoyl-CoA hydratase/carnithine racemase
MGHVSIAQHECVTVLSVDRPPANAMDLALLAELVEAVDRLAADPPPALVLAGRDAFFSMVLALCGDHRVASTVGR